MTKIEKAELALKMLEEGLYGPKEEATSYHLLAINQPIVLDLLLEADMLESWDIYRLDQATARKENRSYCCAICNAFKAYDCLQTEINQLKGQQ